MEDLGVGGSIVIDFDRRKTGWEHMDWIHLAQHRDQWWALVNMVMNLQLP
jgi:hypothetical protein